jgi:hypothetical protein
MRDDRQVFEIAYRKRTLRRQSILYWTAAVGSILIGVVGLPFRFLAGPAYTSVLIAIIDRLWDALERQDAQVSACCSPAGRDTRDEKPPPQSPRPRSSKRLKRLELK